MPMAPTDLNRRILLFAAVAAAVGAVDAAIGGPYGLVVVFALVTVRQGALLLRLRFGRPAAPPPSRPGRWAATAVAR